VEVDASASTTAVCSGGNLQDWTLLHSDIDLTCLGEVLTQSCGSASRLRDVVSSMRDFGKLHQVNSARVWLSVLVGQATLIDDLHIA